MLGMAVGSESHGRNMAWKFSFIFIFILFCKKSLGTKSIYAESAEDIAVQRGKHAVLNMQNLKTFSNNSIVCRVEVINDPICLRFGSLSSYSFGCNLAKAQVSYIHSGSTISDEDCLKVKVLLFYNDGTEKEAVKIKIVITNNNRQDLLTTRLLQIDDIGRAASFSKEVLSPVAKKHSNSCIITFPENKQGWPANGKLLLNGNPSYQRSLPCSTFKATYVHDSSYIPNTDFIPFVVTWSDDTGKNQVMRYHLKVNIKGAQKNEPPIAYSRRHRIIIKQYSVTQIKTPGLQAIDYRTDPSKLILKVMMSSRSNLGGYFATIEDPGQPLEGVTQDAIDKGKIILVAPREFTSRRRLAIQLCYVQAIDPYGAVSKRKLRLMFFVRTFVAHYLSVVRNNPMHVLEGKSCKLTEQNLQIKCPGFDCSRAKFSVLEDPKHGVLVKNSVQVTQFTKYDMQQGAIVYKSDDSENRVDSVVITVSDRNNMAFLTLNIIIEPLDDSPPFLSVHKDIIARTGKRTVIKTDVLEASDHDTVKTRIVFKIAKKASKGKVVKKIQDGTFVAVAMFSEIDLENGLIHYESNFKDPTDDVFGFILSDGGDTPNLSKEYVSRIKILASDTAPPYRRHGGECLVRLNETEASLSLNFIDYIDNYSPSSEIVVEVQPPSGKDTYYITKKDLVGYVGHDKMSVDKFTQQQLFHNKVFFENKFNEVGIHTRSLRLNFVVSDKDGNTTPLQTCTVVVQPVDNKTPVIAVIERIRVLEGGKACINTTSLMITDQDTETRNIKLALKTQPKEGGIAFKSRYLQINEFVPFVKLRKHCLWYNHSDSETTKDVFVLVATDGTNVGENEVPIEIVPVNDQRPVFVNKHADIKVMENSSVVVGSQILKAIDKDSGNANLTFYVIYKPILGFLDTFKSDIVNFTQNDLDNDLLVYTHTEKEIGPFSVRDNFTVIVCDTMPFVKDCTSVMKINVEVVPINSNPPSLGLGTVLVVQEGRYMAITMENLKCSDTDTLMNEIEVSVMQFSRLGYLENTAPSEGSELSNAGVRITKFKCSEIEGGKLRYIQLNHSGFEPVKDKLSVVAFDGKFNSSVVDIEIKITPASDERPTVTQSDVITVQEGGWKLIDQWHIKITDKDIPQETLMFHLTDQPKHGQMFYKCNGGGSPDLKKLANKLSLDYVKCALIYVHDDSETRSDEFKVEATDGRLASGAKIKIKVLPVNDMKPKIVNNITMTVKFGGFKNITKSYLAAQDIDTEDKSLEFKITELPKYGSLKLHKKRGPVRLVENSIFTQGDINKKRLSYVNHIMPVQGLLDNFKFSLSDGVQVLANQTFNIRIRLSCRKYLKVVTKDVEANSPKIFVTSSNLKVVQRKAKAGKTKKRNSVIFHVIKQPLHGVLKLVEASEEDKVSSVTERDLKERRLMYKPYEYPLRKNDTFRFFVTDGKCMQRGRINIRTRDVNATVKHMKRISALKVTKRGITAVTPLELRALEKYSPKKVVYRLISLPMNGILLKDGEAANNFTQEEVNELRITYRLLNHRAVHDQAKIEVFVKDFYGLMQNTKPEKFPFHIVIKIPNASFVRVITNEPITALENLGQRYVGSVISNRNLLSYNCSSKIDPYLEYMVIEPPVHGELVYKDTGLQVSRFKQGDIDKGKVIYKLTDFTHTDFVDNLILDVKSKGCKKVTGIEFGIKWSVIGLSNNVSIDCTGGRTSVKVNLLRSGYTNQGSVVELHIKSLTDGVETIAPSRIWFYPGDKLKSWKMPEEALEYEKVQIFINKEFNTLLGKKSINFDISTAQDACSKQQKKFSKNSATIKADTRITSDKEKINQGLIKRPQRIDLKNCRKGWVEFRNHCYLLLKKLSSWKKAIKSCLRRNSSLFTPTSSSEETVIDKIRRNYPIWIGIKLNKHKRWKWNTKKLERKFVNRLQQMQLPASKKNVCVVMQANGRWSVKNCKQKVVAFVCKRGKSTQ